MREMSNQIEYFFNKIGNRQTGTVKEREIEK